MSDLTPPATAATQPQVHARPQARPIDWPACWLLGLLCSYGAYTLSIALSTQVARFALERFQLAHDGFAVWAAFAPAPFMYNFENRVAVSPRPLSSEERSRRAREHWLTVNHYPARALTFGPLRQQLFARPSDSYVYLESRYGELRVVTSYRVLYAREGSREGASITRWEHALE